MFFFFSGRPFSIILLIFRKKKIEFPQESYDSLFYAIENNLRELGFGDVGVNKKMKDLNKIFYDILLKLSDNTTQFNLNKKLIHKYFVKFVNNDKKLYKFDDYFLNKNRNFHLNIF